MSSTRAEDLAARFEAERFTFEQPQRNRMHDVVRRLGEAAIRSQKITDREAANAAQRQCLGEIEALVTEALAARDMARAGAAGGAGEGFVLVPARPTPAMLEAFWQSTGESHAMRERTEMMATRRYAAMLAAAPPPPAQQGEKQRRDEDGFVCEYDPGCKPETDTYTICWDGGARWLIVDRHGLITAGQSPADDRPVQQTTWQALMSPPPAQQGSSSLSPPGSDES